MLRLLLDLDKEAESQAQENMLKGVRKAQAKLASFYLAGDGEQHARKIFADMKDERPERLRSIRDELLRIETKDFWEVIDRGTNFDYVDAARKAQLKVFFSWFPSLSTERSVSLSFAKLACRDFGGLSSGPKYKVDDSRWRTVRSREKQGMIAAQAEQPRPRKRCSRPRRISIPNSTAKTTSPTTSTRRPSCARHRRAQPEVGRDLGGHEQEERRLAGRARRPDGREGHRRQASTWLSKKTQVDEAAGATRSRIIGGGRVKL